MDTAHQFGRQVKALTKKNVISRWRNKTRSLAEILVPLVALLIVHGVSYLVEPTTIPETLPDTSTPLSGGNWMDDMSFGTSLYRPIPTIADLYTRSEAFCKHKTLVSRCEYSMDCDAAGRWWEIVPGDASSDEYENSSACQAMQIGVAPLHADNANAAAEAANFVAWGNAAYGTSNYPPYVLFASNDALEKHTTSKAYSYASGPGDILGAGIVFGSGYPDWDVTLRLNRTVMSSKQRRRMPRTIDPELTTTLRNNNDDADYGNGPPMMPFLESWVKGGFFTLADETNSFVAERTCLLAGICAAGEKVAIQTRAGAGFPHNEYEEEGVWSLLGGFYVTLMSIAMLYPVSNLVGVLVLEKETRQREGMYMMSMQPLALFTSWHIYALMTSIPLALMLSLVGTVNLYTHSDFFYIYWHFQIFFIACASFACVMSQLFSTVRSASMIGNALFFVGFFLYNYLSTRNNTDRGLAMVFSLHPLVGFSACVSIIAALEDSGQGVTIHTVDSMEQGGIGMTYNDAVGMMVLSTCLLVFLTWYLGEVIPSDMGTNRPWYFLVQRQYWNDSWDRAKSVYADVLSAMKNRNTRVHAGRGTDAGADAPGVDSEGGGLEMGSREDPHAFLQGGMHPPMAMAALEPSDTVETMDPSMTAALNSGGGVRIRNLRKEFNTPSGVKIAVDDFSLDVYPNQVTVMLGHNGAGKTTTIGMMTGLIPATAGSVSVGGLNIATSMSAIRQDLGVCPQHDVLFMDLTVDEHLALFADLQMVPTARIPSVVDAMVAEVGLVAKRHQQASKLSGGQKRKLSIAIAFIGDPRIVFLDEPTSGMDPYSRRFTWGLINKLKKGRVIILTTHFMDEADILGDRIAIMGKGKLKCCGSSLFLKSRFGIGYNMTIEKSSEVGSASFSFQQQDVERAISDDGIADWKLLSNVGSEVIYQLPFESVDKFPRLLEKVEASQAAWGVQSYSMSMTTLEEVFMSVSDDHEGEDKARGAEASAGAAADVGLDKIAVAGAGAGVGAGVGAATADSVLQSHSAKEDISSTAYIAKHIWVMMYKRWLMFKHDYGKQSVFLIVVPSVIFWIGIFVLTSTEFYPDQPAHVLTVSEMNPSMSASHVFPLPYSTSGTYCEYCHDTDEGMCQTPNLHNETETCKFVNAEGWGTGVGAGGQGAEETALSSAFDGSLPGIAVGSSTSVFNTSRYLLDHQNDFASATFAAITYEEVSTHTFTGTSAGAEQPLPASIKYTAHSNFTSQTAGPVLTMLLGDALVKTFDQGASVTMRLHPLPTTHLEEAFLVAYAEDIVVTFTALAIPFVAGFYASNVAREKSSKAKYQQMLSGIGLSSYWIGNLLWDFITWWPFMVLAIVVTYLHEENVILIANLDCMVVLLLLYGFSGACFVYLISQFLETPEGALLASFAITLFSGLIFGIAGVVLRLLENRGIIDKIFMSGWRYLFLLFPPYCIVEGLHNIILRERWSFDELPAGEEYDVYDWQCTGASIAFLVIDAICYFSIVVLSDYLGGFPSLSTAAKEYMFGAQALPVVDAQSTKDEDVLAEESRIGGYASEEAAAAVVANEVIVTRDVHKKYPGTGSYAVRGLSLGIAKGECFGLLGINGAGKSTTLAMLTGEIAPRSGSIFLDGMQLGANLHACRRRIGFCPQFDALFPTLTVREHLEVYSMIKGIPDTAVDTAVATKLADMDLNLYADKVAGTLSGGNKRKLSVAMAMIGDPSIVFLDEPSTGMDPVARRHMWQVITDTVKRRGECSVILTTHSMEEAEALCTRLGIMVGGTLRCLGSGQKLRSRYARDYQIELSLSATHEGARDAVLAIMAQHYPGFRLLEEQPPQMRFEVPLQGVDGQARTLSSVFSMLQANRATAGIANYSISQTSLEQIFNSFAKQQEEETLIDNTDDNSDRPVAVAATGDPAKGF